MGILSLQFGVLNFPIQPGLGGGVSLEAEVTSVSSQVTSDISIPESQSLYRIISSKTLKWQVPYLPEVPRGHRDRSSSPGVRQRPHPNTGIHFLSSHTAKTDRAPHQHPKTWSPASSHHAQATGTWRVGEGSHPPRAWLMEHLDKPGDTLAVPGESPQKPLLPG